MARQTHVALSRIILFAIVIEVCWSARETINGHPGPSEEEKDPEYWRKIAKDELKFAKARRPNTNLAKNVIMFLGDGMSISTVFGARVFKGQAKGNPGEEEKLVFENFPNVALSKTYSVNHQISDSACTATAYHCGAKAIYATLGVDAKVTHGQCSGAEKSKLSCIGDKTTSAGKAAGFVTTARITHASPAPLYGWTPDRQWEDDTKLSDEAKQYGCPDMASQLLHDKASKMQVMMGGGRQHLYPDNVTDPEYKNKTGKRKDGKNIVDLWLQQKKDAGKNALYAWHRDNLTNANIDELDFLLGAFEPSHMKYSSDEGAGVDEPTLEEMTEAAIKILQKNDKGFYLFVEAAKIDLALHDGWAKMALEDTMEFEKAIIKAMGMTDEKETLIIVTADHSHGVTFSSYPMRGNPILGFTDWSSDREAFTSDADHKRYTTVSFSNGPGIEDKFEAINGEVVRRNLTEDEIKDRKFRAQSPVNAKYVGHEGGDVGIYARGPWSHLFHTTHEQNYIHHVMAFASCVGEWSGANCQANKPPPANQTEPPPANQTEPPPPQTQPPPAPQTCGANSLAYTSALIFLLLAIARLI